LTHTIASEMTYTMRLLSTHSLCFSLKVIFHTFPRGLRAPLPRDLTKAPPRYHITGLDLHCVCLMVSKLDKYIIQIWQNNTKKNTLRVETL